MTKHRKLRNTTTQEFRDNAVKMVVDDNLEIEDVAKRLGVAEFNLRRWVRVYKKETLVTTQKDMGNVLSQLKALEEENKRLRIEREILKKAMAYFAAPQS